MQNQPANANPKVAQHSNSAACAADWNDEEARYAVAPSPVRRPSRVLRRQSVTRRQRNGLVDCDPCGRLEPSH